MSRVAKKSLPLPAGVEVRVAASQVEVKGPKGTLTQALPTGISLQIENKSLSLDYDVAQSAMAGTMRALLGHMVAGVSKGFERKLELVGVGYRAQMQGKTLNLTLGFSHPVSFEAPAGITLEAPSQTEVWVKGFDKQLVGEVAAKIRAYRPPEPYKGKGVRYAGERITIKEAKKTK